ncbi:MAG: hypothetical protein JW939_08805, partial [Candidatus Thermoplasmatota archaeon]|nr:hypothetical protein [Candidatus Thermoplasmatota archaeon]
LIVNIRERPTKDYSLVLIIMIMIIFLSLIIYGAFLRIQERKQKRLLDSVGTSSPLEARHLSEDDFKEGPGSKRVSEGIPMPPAPLEVEGTLAREEMDQAPYEVGTETDSDMESDLDDIVSELFSDKRGS